MKNSTQRRIKTREQELRAIRERAANADRAGGPLPFPNLWDALDPTKAPPDASDQAIEESYRDFCKLCPPTPRKKHFL